MAQSLRAEWGLKDRRHSKADSAAWLKPLCYGALNIFSASCVVFANKSVFTTHGFHFTCALTWVHTVFTLIGMRVFLMLGMFGRKQLPPLQVLPLALGFTGYIVLCNLSLNMNTVSFYQLMKIAVAPTVIALEALMFKRLPEPRVIAAVVVVCLGICVATVTDSKVVANTTGVLVGLGATVVTALYQIWAGSKQKELRASSMQLLEQYTPQAAVLLGLLVPLMEPLGLQDRSPDTILGFSYTAPAVTAIFISAGLGLLVSLSTFLVIGATSSLTYNVVGHLKTVIILVGGCVWFGDDMPPRKLAGVAVAFAGIVYYTQVKLAGAAKSAPQAPHGVLPTVRVKDDPREEHAQGFRAGVVEGGAAYSTGVGRRVSPMTSLGGAAPPNGSSVNGGAAHAPTPRPGSH